MSTFREHKTSADRSASDRRRHNEKIDRAIKEGIHNIIADESIIGQDDKKKIRIPVRGIKEYRFIYGQNQSNKKVGSAPGKDIQRGQKIGDNQQDKGQSPAQPGDEPGEEYYDVEITLDELSDYLFADLELPELEKKSLKKILSENLKRKGVRPQGIIPRLDKKKTAINRIKRKKAASKRENFDDEEKFSFIENDLTYKHYKRSFKECTNAVIFFVMDISGSMTTNKKFLARSFFFLLYHFIRSKYKHTDIVFVSHDTRAYEVSEDQFFNRGNSGGTMVSSGLQEVSDIIDKRYHPESWNIYVFQASDGDNWPDDNPKTIELLKHLKSIAQLFGYCELQPEHLESAQGSFPFEKYKLSSTYRPHEDEKLKISNIVSKKDVWSAFKSFFGVK